MGVDTQWILTRATPTSTPTTTTPTCDTPTSTTPTSTTPTCNSSHMYAVVTVTSAAQYIRILAHTIRPYPLSQPLS